MKTIIAGTRTITDYALLATVAAESEFVITEVVSGKARGVDSLGEQFAAEWGIPVKEFPALWDKTDVPGAKIRINQYGKVYNANAGHDRNRQMAEYADAAIILWDGWSRGTASMLKLAKEHNLKIYLVNLQAEKDAARRRK